MTLVTGAKNMQSLEVSQMVSQTSTNKFNDDGNKINSTN